MKNQIKKGMLMACAGGVLAFALAASPAFAETNADEGAGMPAGSVSGTVHETATVTAIDKSTRVVTVKNDAGEKHTIQVPSDVKAFDKLKVNDKIDVDYHESLAVAMMPPGAKLSASERSSMMKTGHGAGAAGREVTISAEVVSVDPANNKVTFKGPRGQLKTVTVQDPDMQAKLQTLKPGQVVQFVYTEAVAIGIQPSAK